MKKQNVAILQPFVYCQEIWVESLIKDQKTR